MDQSESLSIKLYSGRFLFIVLITIIISTLSFMKIKLISTNRIEFNPPALTSSSKPKIHCIVYAQRFLGRLGNRMFMVASAYGLARLHSCHLYITPNIINELKKVFILNISSLLISPSIHDLINQNNLTSMNTTGKNVVCQYVPELTRPNAIREGMIFELTGYWQSYLHFAKYGDELRQHIFVATQPVLMKVSRFFFELYQQKFNITPQFSLENQQLFKKQLSQLNLITWIGIHVRRSDFVPVKYSSDDEYLFSAIKYYTSLYANAYFIVATDDKPYCKNLFRNRSNIFFTPESFSPEDDLITLSLCQHSIITGGTFGWWTAYLANGQVIHDKIYPSGCERREYYYPPWFMIDGNVRAHKNSNYTLR